MLSKFQDFVKKIYNKIFYDAILFIIVSLLIFLAFAAGYIIAKEQNKEPIQIEKNILK